MVGKSFPRPQNTASLANPSEATSNPIEHSQEYCASASVPTAGTLRNWTFPLMALLACTMTGGTAAIAFLSLTALPPEADCSEASTIITDRGLLYCVQQAAQSGEIEEVLEGLSILGQWTPSDPLYYEAQASIGKWSQTVLVTAHQKAKANELEQAIGLVNRIPQSSPLYDEAQSLLESWQAQEEEAATIVAQAQDALRTQDWDQVSEHMQTLSSLTTYAERGDRIRELSAQLRQEQESYTTAQSILQLTTASTPQQIGLALEKAKAIDPDTYIWETTQATLEPLAAKLLTYGALQWKQGHLDDAIITAERVERFPGLAAEANRLKQLSQARQLARATDTNWKPSPQHLFQLVEAIAAVRQIPSDSQFYAQAQDSLNSWESQLDDVNYLQVAHASASFGWSPAVHWAAQQAQQLSSDRPRRIQAQTLAAHWNREVERIKDRRYLVWANKLAQPGTRASLKMAIIEANKVQSDRPLYGEAQGLIYGWTRTLESQEDRPYLTLANALARQGQFKEAIEMAIVIKPGRALYNSAQAAVSQWEQQLEQQYQANQQRNRAATNRGTRQVAVGNRESETELVSSHSPASAHLNQVSTPTIRPNKPSGAAQQPLRPNRLPSLLPPNPSANNLPSPASATTSLGSRVAPLLVSPSGRDNQNFGYPQLLTPVKPEIVPTSNTATSTPVLPAPATDATPSYGFTEINSPVVPMRTTPPSSPNEPATASTIESSDTINPVSPETAETSTPVSTPAAMGDSNDATLDARPAEAIVVPAIMETTASETPEASVEE